MQLIGDKTDTCNNVCLFQQRLEHTNFTVQLTSFQKCNGLDVKSKTSSCFKVLITKYTKLNKLRQVLGSCTKHQSSRCYTTHFKLVKAALV